MKIARAQLMQLVKDEIKECEKHRAERDALAREKHRKNEQAYIERYAVAWQSFIDNVQMCLSTGKPITTNDVPLALRDYRSHPELFTPSKCAAMAPSPREVELHGLLKILDAVLDNEVSTYALEKMGFRMGRMLKCL